MFQLSNVARQILSRGLATGRVRVSQFSKFNNTLKELKGDVKNVSKKLNEIETKVQEDVKGVSKKLSEIETKVQEDVKGVSKKLSEIETKVQEDVKGVSKKLSEIETKVQEDGKKLNDIGTKLDMHVKYFPVQTASYVCGSLIGGTTLLTAIGWGLHIGTN
ncbi:tetratricopeptide repeat protein [Rhizophagus clarus]|uniref:Tetratricopeptide repeat protein n=1 Tax=Rhizophagus clarus TaxID=94130 RepID=A0A8H3QQ47_9GLOM|nr:tetratricopeptide repeat protein [Rhizophagus clarus]